MTPWVRNVLGTGLMGEGASASSPIVIFEEFQRKI